MPEFASRQGWTVVQEFTDHAMSGATLLRSGFGFQALMRDALNQRFDVVLAEALDRFSRDQEDIAGLFKRLMKDFLQKAVAIVRARFGGRISYASLPLEGVDWSLFDIVATDAAYRTAAMAPKFRENIHGFVEQARAQGRAVAVTEFGCGAYRSAGDMASRDGIGTIVWGDDGRPVRPNGDFVRDEQEQVRYIRESLEVFDAEGVEAAFVYTFARYDMPYRADPKLDLDMLSAGIVKVLDDQSGAGDMPVRR